MKNKYFTLLLIPEKTASVKKLVIPAWLFRSLSIVFVFAAVLVFMMFLDYWHIMGQIDQNKDLKLENRRLVQEVQIFRNKMESIDNTMDRIRTFENRLRIITNLEDRDSLVRNLNQKKLPDAATNIGRRTSITADIASRSLEAESLLKESPQEKTLFEPSPEAIQIKRETQELDDQFTQLNESTLLVEQELQDLYELLVDQKAFLAALPTRKPTVGYFTSGFGIRKAPFSGDIKMHEGLDIANYPGTLIISTAYGRVKFSGLKPGYGKTVVIDHGYGIETWYGHTRETLVKKGERIKRGQKIAKIGNTGRSTGPHVHYEVRVHGIPVDPLSYILEE